MAPRMIGSLDGPLSARRARLAGPSGVAGLFHNRKTVGIAFFASLGGLVYGCEGFPIPGTLYLSVVDFSRQPGNVQSSSHHDVICKPSMLCPSRGIRIRALS